MSHLGTPSGLPPDERRTLHMPAPREPGEDTLRELAQAGLSDRGLRTISSRRTAKAVRAGLERESRRRRAELKKAERRARILAVIKPGAAWVSIAVVIGVLVYLVGGPFLIAAGVAGGVLIVGPVLWHTFGKKRTGA
jgi:hypothetical protein